MAPVKRAAPPAQRETRSTRSAGVVKKKAAASTKKIGSPVSKNTPALPKNSGVATRKSKNKIDEDKVDEPLVEEEAREDVQATETKAVRVKTIRATASTRANNKSTVATRSLAAAPRRRIKITPLESVTETTAKVDSTPIREDDQGAKTAKKTSKRPQEEAHKSDNGADQSTQGMPETELPKTRQTRKTATKPKEDTKLKGDAAPKTRGRPKKSEAQKQPAIETHEAEADPPKRTTRTRGAGSIATQQSESASEKQDVPVPKPPVGSRKKVTFGGLMDGDDKENQPLPKSKKAAASKGKAETVSTGLRAKPLRKPAAAAATTRGRKAASSKSNPTKSSDENGQSDIKRMPHVLTPKKITQVAKSTTTSNDEDENMSIEEDELNGSKTPVRDLSVSPRRPSNAALARAISPAKKLDFNRALLTQTVTENNQVIQQGHDGALASPARRLPASPVKDSIDLLKDSPRRVDGTKLLFPSHHNNQTDVHASLALNPSNISSASQNMSTLLQSPKRTGVLDAGFFSQSAMKHSAIKSPFKASLLASPAKRLFSSTKKAATPAKSKISEMTIETQEDEEEMVDADMLIEEPESDITVSSHFRASSSPMRVLRIEDERDDMDFDKSVLEVRSPLKVQKSSIKKAGQSPSHDVQASYEALVEPTPVVSQEAHETGEQQMDDEEQHVAPSQLEQTPDMEYAHVGDNEGITVAEHPSDLDDTTVLSCVDRDLTEVPDAASVSASTHEYPESGRSTRSLHLEQPQLHSITLRDDTETSEDELAADETPVRSLAKKIRGSSFGAFHSRMSSGFPQGITGKDFGFTPLAAQLGGWQKTPITTQVSRPTPAQRQESVEFSPLASQHVAGEVMISRHSTPVQKLKLRRSMASNVSAKSAIKNRQSLGLGNSMAQRSSVGPEHERIYLEESPSRDAQFEEYMELRAMEEESNAVHAEEDRQSAEHDLDPEVLAISAVDDDVQVRDEEGDIVGSVNDLEGEDVSSLEEPGELTTDLVNFTNATDTAMIDFNKLAQEAEELAPTSDEVEADVEEPSVMFADEEEFDILSDEAPPIDEDIQPNDESEFVYPENDNVSSIVHSSCPDTILEGLSSPILQATTSYLDSPSVLVIDQSHTETETPDINDEPTGHPDDDAQISVTPVRVPHDFSQARLINTIVSKVPLKPEGAASAIKIQKKRARSFGNSDAAPNKRISFGSLKEIVIPSNDTTTERSPDRRVRTSVAPSPGGTSTPASKHSRSSFGGLSAVSTPGQISFAVDDFGDSTLDGIELPEDEDEQDTELQYDDEDDTPTMDVAVQDANSVPTTPRTVTAATPSTSRRTQSATTPATVKKAPATAAKTNSARKSTGLRTSRTPLKPVSTGVLNGAVVFVDVHTSEGADASGIFVELLAQMGARCVKEWRWNSRASLATGLDTDDTEQRIGITHVVYKDGGKRTLEKVRDAKGDVLCVGVAWVLDCEREGKWLDESNYAIDLSILPRGGSKRRKSMEPRALLHNGDGSLSASRPRRSVSGEMTEPMKQELINTPARGQTPQSSNITDEDEGDEDDVEQATPTGYISYDPRTAMTPGTPYLVSQGKQIVQMSAPPKQTGKRLFEDDEDDQEEDEIVDRGGNDGVKKDAKKFRMRNLDIKARRRTLGFKPVVGSPLAK